MSKTRVRVTVLALILLLLLAYPTTIILLHHNENMHKCKSHLFAESQNHWPFSSSPIINLFQRRDEAGASSLNGTTQSHKPGSFSEKCIAQLKKHPNSTKDFSDKAVFWICDMSKPIYFWAMGVVAVAGGALVSMHWHTIQGASAHREVLRSFTLPAYERSEREKRAAQIRRDRELGLGWNIYHHRHRQMFGSDADVDIEMSAGGSIMAPTIQEERSKWGRIWSIEWLMKKRGKPEYQHEPSSKNEIAACRSTFMALKVTRPSGSIDLGEQNYRAILPELASMDGLMPNTMVEILLAGERAYYGAVSSDDGSTCIKSGCNNYARAVPCTPAPVQDNNMLFRCTENERPEDSSYAVLECGKSLYEPSQGHVIPEEEQRSLQCLKISANPNIEEQKLALRAWNLRPSPLPHKPGIKSYYRSQEEEEQGHVVRQGAISLAVTSKADRPTGFRAASSGSDPWVFTKENSRMRRVGIVGWGWAWNDPSKPKDCYR